MCKTRCVDLLYYNPPDYFALAELEKVHCPWAESVPSPKYLNSSPGDVSYNL